MDLLIDKPELEALPQTGGAIRLDLDDPNKVYVVRRGKVDIFYTWKEDGADSRLFPLTRVEEGGILLGMDMGKWSEKLSLVGICVVGSDLIALDRPFASLNEEDISKWENALEGWFQTITGAMLSYSPPRTHTLITVNQDITLERKQVMFAKDRPLWLEAKQGAVIASDLNQLIEGSWILITRDHWAWAAEISEISTHHTGHLLRNGILGTALPCLHNRLGQTLTHMHTLYEKRASKRLEQQAEADDKLQKQVLGTFASVLGASGTEGMATKVTDPLFAVCSKVAEEMGLKLAPETQGQFNNDPTPTESMLRASNIRTRKVILSGQWWKGDNGPMISRFEKSKDPVALIPDSATTYQLYLPDGRHMKVNQAVADTLTGEGYMLYRPLPETSLNLLDLLKYSRKNIGKDLVMVGVMVVMISIMGLVTPFAMGQVFDQVIPKASRSDLMFVILGLLASSLAGALFSLTQGLAMIRLEGRVEMGLQAAIWDRILNLPVPFFRDYTAGDLIQRAMGIEKIRSALSGQVIMSLVSSISSLVFFFQLFYYNVTMAVVGGVLALIGTLPLMSSLIKLPLERKLQAEDGKLSGLVQQLLLGINKLRVAGAEERAFAQWATSFSKVKTLAYRTGLIQAGVNVWNTAYAVISMIVIFSFLMYVNSTEEVITVGRFIAFNAAFGLFLSGVLAFVRTLISCLSLVSVYERSRPILETLPEATENLEYPGDLSGALEVNKLCFRYKEDGPLILNNVSFKVEPGQFVALVGPSGSGKSTLLRMLLGFEKPESGGVYYDKKELASVDVRAVRRQVGVVLQTSQLVPGTIFENIVGSLPLTHDDAMEAAAMAGFDKDLENMPMGLHTVVSEGGGTLSGGQTQRLMIARALVTKPRILFFDEATSALDNQTQAIVTASLDRLRVTRIVIAHRLSTVINADCIMVVDRGVVVESGTYDELMDQGGVFYRLANRQIA